MRHASLLALTLAIVTGCVDEGSPDEIDEAGIGAGKADGELSDCETKAILDFLNAGASKIALLEKGVHERAAANLAAHRDGADGQFGTADDDPFDTIQEVDEVDYVGATAFRQLVAATVDRCQQPTDLYADARDVTKPLVTFSAGAQAPASYQAPSVDGFYLSGTEFWQKWSGGKNPTYSFSDGTDAGRLCMQASAIRFEAIMKDPPPEMVQLNEQSNWSGSFFNWNDDYSQSDYGDASAARLWAWRTSLIKWISQTKKDGSCLLPTRDLVVKAALACLERGAEIQGCAATAE
jgi:hypothetical protein